MKRSFIIIGLITIVGTLQAQKKMSLEEARNMALEFNRTLKVSASQMIEAEAKKKEAFTNYLPSLAASGDAILMPTMDDIETGSLELPTGPSAEAIGAGNATGIAYFPGMTLETGNLNVLMADVNFREAIYAGGKIRNANKMAESGVVISQQAYQLKEAEVILNSDKAYWRLAATLESVKLAEAYVLMLDSVEQQLNDSYELGLVPKSEQLKVKVQRNDADLNLLKAKNAYKLLQMNLCQIIGLPLNTQIEITEEVSKSPILPDMSNGSSLAQNQRQELAVLNEQSKIAHYQKKMVNADYLPELGVSVGYSYIKVNDLINEGNMMVAGSLQIPIFNWNERKHKRVAAQASMDQVNYQLEDTRELIELEVQQVMIQLQEGYQEVLWAQKNKEEAKENLEETQASFDVGLNTTTDLLNAQASWQDAKVKEVQSLANFEILKTTYLKAIGAL